MCGGGLNPMKAIGSLFGGGGGSSGGGMFAKLLARVTTPPPSEPTPTEQVGEPQTVSSQIGAGATPAVTLGQRRKPRSLLSLVGIGSPGAATVAQPTLKPTLGG